MRPILAFGFGAIEALLLARLLFQILAARAENTLVSIVYTVTTPLVAPLAFLDAGQPRFGAVLELSTLVLCSAIAASLLIAWGLTKRSIRVRAVQ